MHKELLIELGLSNEILDKLGQDYQEGDDKPDLKEIATGLRSSIKNTYLESEDFQTKLAEEKKSLNSQAWNALTGTLSGKAAKYGIEKEKLGDMKPAEIIEMAYNAGTKESGKGVEEHQEALMQANRKIEELTKTHEEAINQNNEKWKTQIAQKEINTLALKLAASRDDTVKIDNGAKVIAGLSGIKESGIKVNYNFDTGEVEVSLPNGGKPQNEKGTETLGFNELFNKQMDKLVPASGGKPEDKGVQGTHNPSTSNGELKTDAALKMKERLEKLKTPSE